MTILKTIYFYSRIGIKGKLILVQHFLFSKDIFTMEQAKT